MQKKANQLEYYFRKLVFAVIRNVNRFNVTIKQIVMQRRYFVIQKHKSDIILILWHVHGKPFHTIAKIYR